LWSSILYLNVSFQPDNRPGQVLSSDGIMDTAVAKTGRSLDAVPNHYVAFRGDLRHGVVATNERKNLRRVQEKRGVSELRLTCWSIIG